MDIYSILEALKTVEGTMTSAEKHSSGPAFTGYWAGKDAGTPGNKMVGAAESVEQECSQPMTLADKLRARWEETKRAKGLQEYGMTTGGTVGMTGGGTASTSDPQQTAADLAQTSKSLSALKNKVPGLNVAKAAAALTKADTNQTLTNPEKDAGLELAPAVTDIIKDPTLAKIVSGAIGTAATSGLVSAVTGGDILKTMTGAGISSAVANSIGTMWNNLRSTTPKLTAAENEYSSKYNQIKDTIPLVDQAKTMENNLNTSATTFNSSLSQYNDTKSQYDDLMTKYNDAKSADDIKTANSFADQINNSIAPKLTDLANQTNSFYDNYQSKLDEYKSFMNNNADAFNTFNVIRPSTVKRLPILT